MISLTTLARRALAAASVVLALAAPAAAQNYEGTHTVRVGAFLQGGSTTLDGTFAALAESGTFGNNGGGIAAGIDWRREAFVLGLEGDIGLAGGQHAFVGAKFDTDYFASLRGRLGVYARPDWLIYATGGLGFRGVTVTELAGPSNSRTLYGGVFGGGTEFHYGNAIFFGEYLRSQYGSGNILVSSGNTYGIKGHSDAFRLGVKFKVGFDGYYDEVRDGLRK